ncbi:uncharacterized protein FIBRA_06234 [Fibroporia radiculosa]|uniref:Uncharacterized protein n=1 Tax=Fibroporia radiculosa TaxID=599839 RepID=J4GSD9_9APHY|nr:uncharacterized protein FIBRA_06234 [Fibroporia radiculosa]CCM04075.1 predicted protein [Fibroporia radiculosa]
MYGICLSSSALTGNDSAIIVFTYAICVLFCNLIVIFSAWFYLHRFVSSEGALGGMNTIARILLRDGTMYLTPLYRALSALNLERVIFYTCHSSVVLDYILIVLVGLARPLSSIVLSRLLLHLQAASSEAQASHTGGYYGAHTKTWLQDLEFARSQILCSELVSRSSADVAEVMHADGTSYSDPEDGTNREE